MIGIGKSTWQGSWTGGRGEISTASGTVSGAPYTYSSRFEDESGASPEELLAAAHAACFNQALAHNLDRVSLTASAVETTVEVTYAILDGRPTIMSSHIKVQASVPGASTPQFEEIAEASARGCTISRVLTCEITLTAQLLETKN